MDIFDYLKKDHQRVSELFTQFKKAKSFVRKKQIIDFLTQELLVHAKAEQDTFYKMLQLYSDSKGMIEHSIKEHSEIEGFIEELSKWEKSEAAFDKKVQSLQKIVDHHVKEEENDLFYRARKIFSKEDAMLIKEKMHAQKLKYYRKFAPDMVA